MGKKKNGGPNKDVTTSPSGSTQWVPGKPVKEQDTVRGTSQADRQFNRRYEQQQKAREQAKRDAAKPSEDNAGFNQGKAVSENPEPITVKATKPTKIGDEYGFTNTDTGTFHGYDEYTDPDGYYTGPGHELIDRETDKYLSDGN